MGWGVYLIVGSDAKEVRRMARQETWFDHSIRHLSTKTIGDGRTLAVLDGDCSVQLTCHQCDAVSCVGCGQRAVIDLDHDADEGYAFCSRCAYDPTGDLLEPAYV